MSDCLSAFWCSAVLPLCYTPEEDTENKTCFPVYERGHWVIDNWWSLWRWLPPEVGRCASAPVPPVDMGGVGIAGWACTCLWSTVLLCIRWFGRSPVEGGTWRNKKCIHLKLYVTADYFNSSITKVQILWAQYERRRLLRLVAGRSPGHIAHSVLSLHLPTVSDLHLQTWLEESQRFQKHQTSKRKIIFNVCVVMWYHNHKEEAHQ